MKNLTFLLAFALANSGHAVEMVEIDPPPLEGVGPQLFGTQPGKKYLPEKAVDSPRPPHLTISRHAGDNEPLPYYAIGPDTYFLFANIAEVDGNNRGFNGNAGFVVTDDGVVAIDALGTPTLGRRMIATIRKVTRQPVRYLILTHTHPDHYYGAQAFVEAFPDIKVISHKGSVDYAYSSTIQRSVAYRKVFLPTDMKGFKAVVPNVLIDAPRFGKTTFKLGAKTFDLYNVDYQHSHGDLVLHQAEDNIVWISDLAFNGRITFMGDGHYKSALEGQKWLLQTFPDARLMVPGHGAPQTPPFPMVARTMHYIQALEAKIKSARERNLGLQDAVNQSELPEFKNDPLYGLNHRPNSNFIFREMEEEDF
ncbi:MBL fold metallo-hydrolase [Sulfuriferula plumbiphila]|uniref:MBL fold metallo-hydrolase n=1 Tax=Sulfuriferula plumbiphila TaxID=171865 RepID=A0A512L877_9PROT|nr:MBL fold metallo-hydrolase [Sulfuriferula plumbiphila]BBP05631.1 MBL fold metallo-hydrolase [Sulfuriferula plumbiphila]GEP30662.1 MBL fold metallo-hydrolase [Sulfuriferula plumbiphila]